MNKEQSKFYFGGFTMRKSLVALPIVALFLLSACGNATEEKMAKKQKVHQQLIHRKMVQNMK